LNSTDIHAEKDRRALRIASEDGFGDRDALSAKRT